MALYEKGIELEEFTNEHRAERARAAFLASGYTDEDGNEPLTNLADFVSDLLHLADVTPPFSDPLSDARLKRADDREAGHHLSLGEFTAARALSNYRDEIGCEDEMAIWTT